MRCLAYSLLAIVFASSVIARTQENIPHVGGGAISSRDEPNLPAQKIGKDDLLGITVYDAPELSLHVRVSADGDIRLPMMQRHIPAAGLYPAELETVITKALTDENVMARPIVTVSVVEYRSRPISVSGAVKKTVTFQATGDTTLLDAISEAEGLADNAGPDILVSKHSAATIDGSKTLTQRISVHDLIGGDDPALNLHLEGGEEIRVPEAGRIYVIGNVKRSGAFQITNGAPCSVLKALTLSEGLESFSGDKVFIYRHEAGSGGRNEIPVDLKKILKRQSPDVALLADDILYVPGASGVKAGLKALETTLNIGAIVGSAAVYTAR